jgi:hypothetical protein
MTRHFNVALTGALLSILVWSERQDTKIIGDLSRFRGVCSALP